MRKAATRDPGAVTGPPKSRSTAERVAAQLTTWPGLATGRPSCGAGRGFAFRGTQILHLHTGDEADLRLTRSFIDRVDQVLAESGQIVVRPGDDWVTVRLDTDTAGSLLISLMSLAIQAVEDRTTPARPCTWERTRRGERSGRSRAETTREASAEDERPVGAEPTRRGERLAGTERARRDEESERPDGAPWRAPGATEAAREEGHESRRPDDSDQDRRGEGTLAAGASARSLPRPLRRVRPLRQR
ncbi:luciferase family protein [Actinoallomurus sp. NPDC052308]|uniref:luciferase domain-containing protein n=1 Tax=Actinoallomurus sp. NPDC052308 TaxID=3155530 RepID=UPI0034253E5E